MVIVNTRKFRFICFIFVIFFVSKSHADEGVQVSGDPQSKAVGAGSDSGGECKEPEVGSDDKDRRAPSQEEKGSDSSKLDNSEPPAASNVEEKIQIVKVEDEQRPPEVVEPKPQSEKSESSDQPSEEPEEKIEETKSDEVNRPLVAADSKRLNSKDDENTHKINLNDVNTYSADEDHSHNMKRDISYSEFLGLPRDASYFFEDLEPFINNNSNNRINRAASSKLTGRRWVRS
uniref:Uncharacterized protein n=1 Tax=Graphocephala atropunctata TaxID=36148 RepID=A0A1B6MPB8_9HEMI